MREVDKLLHEWPQITNQAIDWLDSTLTPRSVVFEWGSGGSTLYIAKRAKKIISVEHNKSWQKKVATTAKAWDVANCRCFLVPPEPVPIGKSDKKRTSADPKLYLTGVGKIAKPYRKMGMYASFEKYVKVVDKYADDTFDLVFVDGRARNSCVMHARAKIRRGGFLMLDDAQRRRYDPCKRMLADWECIDFTGTGKYKHKVWRTMVWEKP